MINKNISINKKTEWIEAFLEDEKIVVRKNNRPKDISLYSYVSTEYGLTRILKEILDNLSLKKEV